jgi:putative transposase
MRMRYPRHLAAFCYVGLHRYSLTFCAAERAPRFTDPTSVSDALSQILRAAGEEEFSIIAYCFMPDHLHLIVEGVTERSDLKRFVQRAKQYSGYLHAQRTGQRLWQRYGYEHVIRDEESLSRLVRYVIENPVRARLTEHPRDYPFLGSGRYTLTELIDFAFGQHERSKGSG